MVAHKSPNMVGRNTRSRSQKGAYDLDRKYPSGNIFAPVYGEFYVCKFSWCRLAMMVLFSVKSYPANPILCILLNDRLITRNVYILFWIKIYHRVTSKEYQIHAWCVFCLFFVFFTGSAECFGDFERAYPFLF